MNPPYASSEPRRGAARLFSPPPPVEGPWLKEHLAGWAAAWALVTPSEAALLSADGPSSATPGFWRAQLEGDERLRARIVDAAEAPMAGRRSPGAHWGPVDSALLRLGPAGARRRVVGDVVTRLFPLRGAALSRLLSVRRHSIGVAVAAAAVARETGALPPGSLFLAGLVHDLGKLLLLQHGGDAYLQLEARAGAALSAAERQALGFDHGELGEAALTAMGLPLALASAVRDHHRLTDRVGEVAAGAHLARLACLSLGETLADGLGYADDGGIEVGPAPPPAALAEAPAARVLGLSARRLRALMKEVEGGSRAALRALSPGGEGSARGIPLGLRALWGDGGPSWRPGPTAAVAGLQTPSLVVRFV